MCGVNLKKFTSSKWSDSFFEVTNDPASHLSEENQNLKAEIDRLHGIIFLLKRGKFGSTSERVVDLPVTNQLTFNEIEQVAAELSPPDEMETVTYDRKKGRGKKKPFPEHLPREERIIDLPDSEKICPHDGTKLEEMGEDVSEKLKAVPAQFSVIVEIKKKYSCRTCESHVAQAKSNSILPGTTATPELLSYLVFSKFFQGLPLYRLEELFKLNGIGLTRGTMARWLIQVTDELMPIYNLLQDYAFDSHYMAIDATGVQVLKEPGRSPQSKSFMWARGSPEKGIVLFDYDPSGGGRIAKSLMAGFEGALQADAHQGYGALPTENLLRLGCMMHSRRRFDEAYVIGKKKPGIASEALALFKWIYDREEDYKKRGLTPAERKEIRDKELKPSFEEIKKWAGQKLALVPKSSPIGNALNYFIEQYEELTAFLADGRYEIDNGWIERSIRKFAIGRNAWLFCDSVEGAKASSVLYSLAITAKLNGKDPYVVMTDIFTRLPQAKTAEDYERLTQLLLSPTHPNSCQKKG
jgi:transposase